jgi:hypothetical protein
MTMGQSVNSVLYLAQFASRSPVFRINALDTQRDVFEAFTPFETDRERERNRLTARIELFQTDMPSRSSEGSRVSQPGRLQNTIHPKRILRCLSFCPYRTRTSSKKANSIKKIGVSVNTARGVQNRKIPCGAGIPHIAGSWGIMSTRT